jgi:hypothetical protein
MGVDEAHFEIFKWELYGNVILAMEDSGVALGYCGETMILLTSDY